jgi:hypothetical protein
MILSNHMKSTVKGDVIGVDAYLKTTSSLLHLSNIH